MNPLIQFLGYAGIFVFAVLAVYLVVRVASAAFFKSKLDVERIPNGTKQRSE